jgi:hypothetical protein
MKLKTALLILILISSQALALRRGGEPSNQYWFLSLDMTEVGGEFDGSLFLYSASAIYDVPEIGLGFGLGAGYGIVQPSGWGGDFFMKIGGQSAGDYGSGWFCTGVNVIFTPQAFRFGENSRFYLKLGLNWTSIWIDGSEFYLYGGDPADAHYNGIGLDFLAGIEMFRGESRKPHSLRIEGGFRKINYGSVNTIEIEDGLDGASIIAGLSYNFWL